LRRRSKSDTVVPFQRELEAVRQEYDRVVSALGRRDPNGVRVTACRLVRAWLQMEAAFIRFIEHTPAGLGLGPQAWRERLTLAETNRIARELLRRALTEMSRWYKSPDEWRILRELLCWFHQYLGVCSVVGFPDLSSPHAPPFTPPSAGSHGRANRSRVRGPTRKR
jgi:hypothetical protein